MNLALVCGYHSQVGIRHFNVSSVMHFLTISLLERGICQIFLPTFNAMYTVLCLFTDTCTYICINK